MAGHSIGRQTIALIAAQADVAAAFMAACRADPATGEVTLPATGEAVFKTVAASALAAGQGLEDVMTWDAGLLLVRFADHETLGEIRAALGRLPAGLVRSLNVVLCRNGGETEFKMSCPKCGQKLMIRDALAFKRVNCPNCQKAFTVPGQSDLLHEQLAIPALRSIRKANLADPASCAQALSGLVWQAHEISQDAKASTMRIDLTPGETA